MIHKKNSRQSARNSHVEKLVFIFKIYAQDRRCEAFALVHVRNALPLVLTLLGHLLERKRIITVKRYAKIALSFAPKRSFRRNVQNPVVFVKPRNQHLLQRHRDQDLARSKQTWHFPLDPQMYSVRIGKLVIVIYMVTQCVHCIIEEIKLLSLW